MNENKSTISYRSISELKKDVRELENISENAIENFETELYEYSRTFANDSTIEIITLTPERSLKQDIKKIF